MFPYRRGGKKRGKGGGAGGGPAGGRRFEAGRRGPGGLHELIGQMQPATKALAQVLAGNARVSGQLAHARNLLAQAERLIEEQGVERLPPAHREELLEQLARLKLTVADADAALAGPPEPVPETPARPPVAIAKERLRELALSLAVSAPREPPPPPRLAEMEEEPEPAEPTPARPEPSPVLPPGSPRAARLRLKATVISRDR
jgi:hypothetical protein